MLPRHSKITNITILARDKDSTVVIMNKIDYVNKVQGMINDGIVTGKYTTFVDAVVVRRFVFEYDYGNKNYI